MKPFETIPVRMPIALDDRIAEVAHHLGKSKQETMRLCLDIGAKWITAHDYDVEQKIVPVDVIETMKNLLDDALARLCREADRLSKIHTLSALPDLRAADEENPPRPAETRKPVTYKPTKKPRGPGLNNPADE